MKELIEQRIENLRKKMSENNLDVILSVTVESSSRNPRYLSNFSGSLAYIIISQEKAIICTDSRYWEQTVKQSPLELFKITMDNSKDFLEDQLSGYKTIGFEANTTSVSFYNSLLKKMNDSQKLVEADEMIGSIRLQKDPKEVDLIIKANNIAIKALDELLNDIKPGKTEKELAAKLEYLMIQYGASDKSFGTIFASGFRGALPHGLASEKVINKGEFIVIDYGCVYEGYCSDITRTIAVGEPTEQMLTVYNTVKRAQQESEDAVQMGKTGAEIDEIARNIITEAGYGQYFGHGLGHGVGLDVHEEPSVSPRNDKPLQDRAVITIEPGIYLPGKFGVRIEDDVYITGDTHKVLTNYSKELIVLK